MDRDKLPFAVLQVELKTQADARAAVALYGEMAPVAALTGDGWRIMPLCNMAAGADLPETDAQYKALRAADKFLYGGAGYIPPCYVYVFCCELD